MQKIKLILLMTGICAHSFFVKAEPTNLPTTNKQEQTTPPKTVASVYQEIDFKGLAKLNPQVFEQAYIGYLNLSEAGKLPDNLQLLTICDFSLSANTKRLWVIDMNAKEVLFHSLVAHGQGTGEEFAEKFSDRENSHQSSLGFYITDETYMGSNGYSLRLHGQDKGYNGNAFDRAIVMHGAPYVSPQFIKNNKRLGRSWGCPAVPTELAKPIINTIKGGSVLFVYYPSKSYATASTWLSKMPLALQSDKEFDKIAQVLHKNTLATKETTDEYSQSPLPATKHAKEPSAEQQVNTYNGVQLATPNQL